MLRSQSLQFRTHPKSHSDSGFSPWFKRPRPLISPSFRLVCFPHAGGNASVYRRWAERVPAGVEVYAVELPGRQSRYGEPLLRDLRCLLEELGREIVNLSSVPMVFFGHSFGGLIAFELTRNLRELGQELPRQLYISASRPPHLRDSEELMHQLSDEEFIERLTALGGLPEKILNDQEMLSLVCPIVRADIQMYETWKSPQKEPLPVGITVFGGWEDRAIAKAELMEWAQYTTSGTHLYLFEGDHFFYQTQELELLRVLSAELDALARDERLSA